MNPSEEYFGEPSLRTSSLPDIMGSDEKENQELSKPSLDNSMEVKSSEGAKKGKTRGKFIYLFKVLQFLITITMKVKFPYI